MSMANRFHQKIHNLSLAGAYLRNASFNKLDLSFSNFSNSQLDDADFTDSVLEDADFSDARIVRTDFSSAIIRHARFIRVHARRAQLFRANGDYVIFTDGDLNWAVFNGCKCNYVDCTKADLEKAQFEFTQLKNSTFVGSKLVRTIFSNATMENANLSNSQMDVAEFSLVQCDRASFVRAQIHECCFFKASARYTDMNHANLKGSDFSQAKLFTATLAYANLINVTFNGTDFRQLNLSYSKFGRFDESQLKSVISIRDAQLFNNSIIAHDQNLIMNGHAQCNTSVDAHWSIEPKNSISIISDKHKSDNCIFVSSSITGSIMSQNVSVTKFIESNLYRQLIVVVTLTCGGDNQTLISVTDINGNNVFSKVNVKEKATFITIRFPVMNDYRFVVNIIFGPNANNSWCDDMDFTLESSPKL